ncbi:MAG: F420-dependent oxidoreductase [Amycolatopsis sp.]|jgi:probable F420-dependent oxidoreductase|uniref:LLM class F420-dependent oxidoreductase n=1 Tax=Amycolatopsis sp. TaxID=37632 RepID=UPI00262FD351|nr:LLM class F420-dependent oxidoreductase [Amycolatopsis sp.]MCU1686870.1 F420-dependent oxidoreductase [Amycolatopsis sp.]
MGMELGRFGAWLNPVHGDKDRKDFGVEAEALGYGTVWLGGGVTSIAELRLVEEILDATSAVTVATSIVNVWTNDPAKIARSYHRIADKYADRFVLGVGIGHPESIKAFEKPYDKLSRYLDELDAAGVPAERLLVGALGKRMLALSRDRSAGAHPYLTVPEHTRQAREILGADSVLAVEHMVVVEPDPVRAREIGRPPIATPYLGLANYVSNLRRLGFGDEDIENGGSDKLIDALALHGEPEVIVRGLSEHLDAGGDHVGIQVLVPEGVDPMPGYRDLAKALF